MQKNHVIILAAGQGIRMKSETPKPLIQYQGRAFLDYVIQAAKDSGVCARPTIVVSPGNQELIKQTVGSEYNYVVQAEQLGTGHAVMTARESLQNQAENIIVLYADHPLIRSQTVKNIADKHEQNDAVLTMAIVKLPDFDDWRQVYYDFGRIVRNEKGEVAKNVEFRNATEEEKKITEVNPVYCCFEAKWLWSNLDKLDANNKQGEYLLTDLIKMAIEQEQEIETVEVEDLKEGVGINSVEELEMIG